MEVPRSRDVTDDSTRDFASRASGLIHLSEDQTCSIARAATTGRNRPPACLSSGGEGSMEVRPCERVHHAALLDLPPDSSFVTEFVTEG